jgi:hypothetical protein
VSTPVHRLTCVTAVMVAGLALAAAGPRSTSSGVYTDEQANAGGIERAPALAGAQFLESWRGRNLRRLLDRIDEMPPTEPRSLSPADAVAVLSFLLRASEMPSGPTALPTDRTQLGEITIERAP